MQSRPDRETKHREVRGRAQAQGKHPEPESKSSTKSLVRCLHVFIDVVGSHCGDMRVMGLVADPEPGH